MQTLRSGLDVVCQVVKLFALKTLIVKVNYCFVFVFEWFIYMYTYILL